MPPVPVLIIRDARESPRKCTIAALRGLPNITIRGWQRDTPIDISGTTFLHPGGDALTLADADRPLLIVDSSWHHLAQIMNDLTGRHVKRSIPAGFVSAYPRKSRIYQDPQSGLASVEALYIALTILGGRRDDILEPYHFRNQFLELNANKFSVLNS
ncbi:MAG: ribosome biogenesis domain-containing protein [Planctomycetota bacterium]